MSDDDSNVVTLHPDGSNPAKATRKRKSQRIQPGPISGAKALTAEEKASKAAALRIRNYSLQQIADEVGYADPSGAWRAIMRYLATEYPESQRDQLRRVELAKLDRLEAAHLPAALNGAPVMLEGVPLLDPDGVPYMTPPSPQAAKIVQNCIQMRSRLQGLEAPQQVQLSTREGEPVEIKLTHSLDPVLIKAAETVRDAIVRQSVLRSGDVVDVVPPAETV